MSEAKSFASGSRGSRIDRGRDLLMRTRAVGLMFSAPNPTKRLLENCTECELGRAIAET